MLDQGSSMRSPIVSLTGSLGFAWFSQDDCLETGLHKISATLTIMGQGKGKVIGNVGFRIQVEINILL